MAACSLPCVGGDPSDGKGDPQDAESSGNPLGAERGGGAEEWRSRGAELPFAHWPMWKWTLEVATGSRGRAPAASEQVCAAAAGGGGWWEPLAKNRGGPLVGLK